MTNTTRRTILAGLAAAPVAGLQTLAGALARPELTAEEREELLDAYDEWLFYERRMLHIERFGLEASKRTIDFVMTSAAHNYHFASYGNDRLPQPSTRAALVLSAVGCPWQDKA